MQTVQQDFSKRHFRSPEDPDRAWMEWYREEFSRRLYHLDIEPRPDTRFKVETIIRALPDVALAQSVRSPMRTLYRGEDDGDFSLVMPLAGTLEIDVKGIEYKLGAGMFGLGRHGAKGIVDAPLGVRLLSVRLRRRLLLPLLRRYPEMQGFVAIRDTQAAALLRSYVTALDAEDVIITPEMRDVVTLHIHDLVALAYGATRDAEELIEERGKRAARFSAIKSYILNNLSDPALSVSTAAASQGVTPRYLHMLFEVEGVTFSEYVLEQRLARAYRMLVDERLCDRSIASIALAVGFGDLSYFNRTFRRRFGDTPSAARATTR